VNVYGGVTWFGADGFARLLRWSFLLDAVELRRRLHDDRAAFRAAVGSACELVLGLVRAAGESGYRVDRLVERASVD
jgi:hypothetical protein